MENKQQNLGQLSGQQNPVSNTGSDQNAATPVIPQQQTNPPAGTLVQPSGNNTNDKVNAPSSAPDSSTAVAPQTTTPIQPTVSTPVEYSYQTPQGGGKKKLLMLLLVILLLIAAIVIYMFVLSKKSGNNTALNTNNNVPTSSVIAPTPIPSLSAEETELNNITVVDPQPDLQNLDSDLQQL